MKYTMCTHNLIKPIRKSVNSCALVISNDYCNFESWLISLQLRIVIYKRELGNRYGPY